jgi:hypothetical protein
MINREYRLIEIIASSEETGFSDLISVLSMKIRSSSASIPRGNTID